MRLVSAWFGPEVVMSVGARVTLVGGSFDQMEGVVKAVSDGQILVTVKVFGRDMDVAMDPSNVRGLASPEEVWQEKLEHRAKQVRENTETLWWSTDAPADALEASRAVRVFRESLDARIDAAKEAALAELRSTVGVVDPKPVIDRHLPRVALTEAIQRAWDEGRTTMGGTPKLSDQEWGAVHALNQKSRDRAEAARLAGALADLPPDPDAEARRARARAETDAIRDSVLARVRDLVGLTLPDHVFAFHAFWKSLSEDEAAVMEFPLGIGPGMLFDWFEDPSSRTLIEGMDVRLHGRFTGTPPEMLHALWGDTDGLHWGLWYDADDAEPMVVSFFGRDGGGIGGSRWTLLGVVVERIFQMWSVVSKDRTMSQDRRDELHARMDQMLELARSFDDRSGEQYKLGGRVPTCDDMGIWLPPGQQAPTRPSIDELRQAIRSDDPIVQQWTAEAHDALAAGDPMPALALGRDLHWVWNKQRSHHAEAAADLMARAHDALGNPALAAIARAHAGEERCHSGIGVYRG